MTPLIDMAFLLIVFFVLCGQINAVENISLNLPQPTISAARAPGDEPRVIVNVVPASNGAALGYLLGRKSFEPTPTGISQLAKTLAESMRAQPATEINIRADRATEYRWVRPVMDAVSNALVESGVPRERARVKLVVLGGAPA
jgi:biopolymer transport protein ExbD